MQCPECKRPMVYKGTSRYECLNPECSIIEVEVNKYGVRRIKRDSRGRIIKEGVMEVKISNEGI